MSLIKKYILGLEKVEKKNLLTKNKIKLQKKENIPNVRKKQCRKSF